MNKLSILLLAYFFCHVASGFQKGTIQTFNKIQPAHFKLKESALPVSEYNINDLGGLGHQFDGVGGLSGGGATSRLLVNYAEPYRSQILDYLFKPGFGASLHILKVEIGGDSQSTEGTEHSHMHNQNEENYTRGYEWWLMKEAKSRNPDITLIGLPWGWPGWVGQGYAWPYHNRTLAAMYITKWVRGAHEEHGLTIDYVGIWNERPYDVEYIKILRKTLDTSGFSHVSIIASDDNFIPISDDILKDPELANAVEVIGAHYPGTVSGDSAQKTNKPLWSSEDYSTFNDGVGAGCWARILNQNYVNGNMTATIAWNLIASYYDDLPYNRCSIMTANEPWSGHYEETSVLWVTAHTTQFTKPGWFYLPTSGHFSGGGSYVALTDGKGSLTVILETMSHDQSVCIRPPLPAYNVEAQNITFVLGGSLKGKVKSVHLWQTQLGVSTTPDTNFVYKGEIAVDEAGKINLFLPIDSVITLSTINHAQKGKYPKSPPSRPFPLPYHETFLGTAFDEASNFADQSGAFENFFNGTSQDGHQWTLRQVVKQSPVAWCDDPNLTITEIGDFAWSAVAVNVSVKIEETNGVFVALRVNQGGCVTREAGGLFFWLRREGVWTISSDIGREHVLKECVFDEKCWLSPFYGDGWNDLRLAIGKENKITAYLNGVLVYERTIKEDFNIPSNGFVAIGTMDFNVAQFDDFSVTSA